MKSENLRGAMFRRNPMAGLWGADWGSILHSAPHDIQDQTETNGVITAIADQRLPQGSAEGRNALSDSS